MIRWPVLLAAVALSGCGGTPPQPTQSSPLDLGWPGQVVAHPEAFAALVDGTDRDGWAALHRNDFQAAVAAFDGDGPGERLGRGRAEWELAALYGDLARSADLAWLGTFATWTERSSLPEGSAMSYAAGLAARDAGDPDLARAWFKLATRAEDPEVARAAALLADLGPRDLVPGADLPPLIQRANAHLEARRTGADVPWRSPAEPMLVEEGKGSGGERIRRAIHDPQVLRTLSEVHRLRARQALGDDLAAVLARPPEGVDPLAALLFGPVLSAEDMAAEATRGGEPGAGAPSLAALGIAAAPAGSDDPEAARARVRALDEALDAWVTGRRVSASDDGRALLEDLALVPVFRSRLLVALGREAMATDRPQEGLVYAQLALDLKDPRAIGPVNHPALQALLVEGQLRTGRTREALDALEVLVDTYPALTGLDEVVGDLAILQGLDRYGDSKEN